MRLSNKSWGMWVATFAIVGSSILTSCNKTPGYGRRSANNPGKKVQQLAKTFLLKKMIRQTFLSPKMRSKFPDQT